MASGQKTVIRASEALNHIRSGMSDTALMAIYSISAKGLESLFWKLVEAELISVEELERRMLTSMRSHVVDLDSYTGPVQEKSSVKINTSEAVGLVRSGMSDAAIMEHFNISTRGLESLFTKLVAAGKISEADLDSRNPPAQSADVALIGVEENFSECTGEPDNSPGPSERDLASAFRKHKMLAAAALGFVAGVLLSLSAYLLVLGTAALRDTAPALDGEVQSAKAQVSLLQQQAEHLIKVLESITREGSHEAKLESTSTRSEFEECLKKCDKEFPAPDDADRVLLFNCKKACIAKFSDRMKKLRQTYYGSAEE